MDVYTRMYQPFTIQKAYMFSTIKAGTLKKTNKNKNKDKIAVNTVYALGLL